MAGLIKREDIDEVRQRTDIKEIVDGYVTLKGAGLGSFKGLCPFHDERSPSFHVRPQVGTLPLLRLRRGRRRHLLRAEAGPHHLPRGRGEARRTGSASSSATRTAAPGPNREDVGRRQRLLDAHKVADEFFRAQLLTPGAADGRNFLAGRGFDRAAAEQFGVGYAPQGWDALLKHLPRPRLHRGRTASSRACSPKAAAGSTTVSAAG